MKERPIIFSSKMIKAILENRKSMTRRVVSKKVLDIILNGDRDTMTYEDKYGDSYSIIRLCPYGQIKDYLWVKETFGESALNRIEYKAFPADGKDFRSVSKWKSPYFMKRDFSRITLEIMDIKVEKLQDISNEDAEKEGIICKDCESYNGGYNDINCRNKLPCDRRIIFSRLWNSIHKKEHTWKDNPLVWILAFKKIDEKF